MESEEGIASAAIIARKSHKGKYTVLLNKLVACRWIDITSYDVDNLDNFIDSKEYAHQSYVFVTLGKFLGEDDVVVIISPSFAEKNPCIKQRKASIYAIPKKCILKIAELDFVDCEENNEEKLEFQGDRRTGEAPGRKS